MKKISIVFLLMAWGFSLYAQDVITLRNGNQIQAKVTEISSAEIKYKRFDHLDGPTIVIARADVHAIAFANGIHEIFNPLAEPSPAARPTATMPATTPAAAPAIDPPPATEITDAPTPAPVVINAPPPSQMAPTNEIRGPHRKNFYAGFYFNPMSALVLYGASMGAELTIGRKFIIDPYVRFPKLSLLYGLDNINGGLGLGIAPKFFTGGRKGGFYVGPNFEYLKINNYEYLGVSYINRHAFLGVNLGGKVQFSSGYYMRFGGTLGARTNLDYDDIYPFINLDLCFGFSF